jgi:hypothetical protein
MLIIVTETVSQTYTVSNVQHTVRVDTHYPRLYLEAAACLLHFRKHLRRVQALAVAQERDIRQCNNEMICCLIPKSRPNGDSSVLALRSFTRAPSRARSCKDKSTHGEPFRQFSLVWDKLFVQRFYIVKGKGKHNGLNLEDLQHMQFLYKKWFTCGFLLG